MDFDKIARDAKARTQDDELERVRSNEKIRRDAEAELLPLAKYISSKTGAKIFYKDYGERDAWLEESWVDFFGHGYLICLPWREGLRRIYNSNDCATEYAFYLEISKYKEGIYFSRFEDSQHTQQAKHITVEQLAEAVIGKTSSFMTP